MAETCIAIIEPRAEPRSFPQAVGVAGGMSVNLKVLTSHRPHIFLTPEVRSPCFIFLLLIIQQLCSLSQSSLFACILWIYTAGCFGVFLVGLPGFSVRTDETRL